MRSVQAWGVHLWWSLNIDLQDLHPHGLNNIQGHRFDSRDQIHLRRSQTVLTMRVLLDLRLLVLNLLNLSQWKIKSNTSNILAVTEWKTFGWTCSHCYKDWRWCQDGWMNRSDEFKMEGMILWALRSLDAETFGTSSQRWILNTWAEHSHVLLHLHKVEALRK